MKTTKMKIIIETHNTIEENKTLDELQQNSIDEKNIESTINNIFDIKKETRKITYKKRFIKKSIIQIDTR